MSTNWTNLLPAGGLLVLYALTSCTGLYLMKTAEFIKSKVFFAGLILYIAGALLWMVILRLMPLSLAFPIAAGVLVIGTMLTGVLLLGEIVTTWQLAGSIMIMIGIALMSIGR